MSIVRIYDIEDHGTIDLDTVSYISYLKYAVGQWHFFNIYFKQETTAGKLKVEVYGKEEATQARKEIVDAWKAYINRELEFYG